MSQLIKRITTAKQSDQIKILSLGTIIDSLPNRIETTMITRMMMMNMGDLIKVHKIIKIGQGCKIMINTLKKEITNIIIIKIKGLNPIITLIIRTLSGEEGIKCKMIGTLRNSRNRLMTIRIQNITRIKDNLLKILTTNTVLRISTRMNINVRMMTVYKTVTVNI
jgi:hypothetical protein